MSVSVCVCVCMCVCVRVCVCVCVSDISHCTVSRSSVETLSLLFIVHSSGLYFHYRKPQTQTVSFALFLSLFLSPYISLSLSPPSTLSPYPLPTLCLHSNSHLSYNTLSLHRTFQKASFLEWIMVSPENPSTTVGQCGFCVWFLVGHLSTDVGLV